MDTLRKHRELNFWFNTEGTGKEAILYAVHEGKRYLLVLKHYDFDTDTSTHVRTVRTDSLDYAFECANAWTL